ncbi:MAG: DHH family phosphoesterase, partial [Candidatus Methanomethyliaceae archaeon]|nr:DHH family phosphoesterase [Candidatus Methanomethyliaceae archaeon]
ARSLVDIGADIAFVINTTNEYVRITGRVSESFHCKTGFNLVEDIIKPLTKSFNGQGGGHATAATMHLFNINEAPISKLLDLILNKLNLPRSSLLEIDIKK